jgi:hypothetical protein
MNEGIHTLRLNVMIPKITLEEAHERMAQFWRRLFHGEWICVVPQ